MRGDVAGRLRFRLTFSDVDAVQFFFADYYRWMERALAELMAECGYPRAESLRQRRGFPVVESGCRYLSRAVVDDVLEVTARFDTMSEHSFRVAYTFTHADGRVVANGFTTHVAVDVDAMASCPVPAAFRAGGEQAGLQAQQPATQNAQRQVGPEMDEMTELARVSAELQRLRTTTRSPGAAMALRRAVSDCHLAMTLLGGDGLAPEIDEPAAP